MQSLAQRQALHTRRRVLTGVLATSLFAPFACPAVAQQRTVVDGVGRVVKIPSSPQRVVSLFDVALTLPLYELGVSVVGSSKTGDDVYSFEDLFGLSAEEAGITDIGEFRSTDIEHVAALEPDLIVTEASIEGIDALAQIAPTYVIPYFSDAAPGLSAVEELARDIGRHAELKTVRAAYEARLSEVRAKLEQHRSGATYVAVMPGNQILIMSGPGALKQVMIDLDLQEPDWVAEMRGDMALDFPISAEKITQIDADFVILLTQYWDESDSSERADEAMEAILPGWDRFLPAARENRLVRLSGRLALIPAYAAAHRFLDALEQQIDR